MSEHSYKLVDDVVAGRYEQVRQQAKAELREADDALPYALAGLALVSHGVPTVRARDELALEQKQLLSALFRVALAALARRMLRAHPEVEAEVLGHDGLSTKLTVGPLKRLSRVDQATKLLRVLLAESHRFIQFRERGLFDWDDGDAHAAAAIVYGWGGRIVGRRGLLQRSPAIHREARDVLEAAGKAFPENLVVEAVRRRFALAWRSLTPEEVTVEHSALQRIGTRRAGGSRGNALRMVCATSTPAPRHGAARRRALPAATKKQPPRR